MSVNRRQIIRFSIVLVLFLTASYVVYALFADSHNLYTNKISAANGSAEMCVKCHPSTVVSVIAGKHGNASCICHGYNVNVSENRMVNVTHNLTKQIYCTNCHADFNETGEITIYYSPVTSGLGQSAHYITNNTTKLYNHAIDYFINESYPRP